MDIETASIDEIERQLLRSESVIARARASQVVLLREVDRRQGALAAGCRSLREWVAGRLDVAPETARDLVATMRRLEDLPDVADAVASGAIGFDRAVAVGRFASRDDNLDVLGDMAGCDVVGIRTLAAKRRRMRRVDEECAFRDRYLTVQPNIDESAWSLNGPPPRRCRPLRGSSPSGERRHVPARTRQNVAGCAQCGCVVGNQPRRAGWR